MQPTPRSLFMCEDTASQSRKQDKKQCSSHIRYLPLKILSLRKIGYLFFIVIIFLLYRNNLKNRNFGKEAPQNFDSERATIAERQGASENQNCEVYHNRSPGWNFGCVKVPGFNDKKGVHIGVNIDPFFIVEPRELSRGPNFNLVSDCGIKPTRPKTDSSGYFGISAWSKNKEPLLSACLTNEERKDLDYFFRFLIFENYGGFVLFGSKPLCEMYVPDTRYDPTQTNLKKWISAMPEEERQQFEMIQKKAVERAQKKVKLKRNPYQGLLI